MSEAPEKAWKIVDHPSPLWRVIVVSAWCRGTVARANIPDACVGNWLLADREPDAYPIGPVSDSLLIQAEEHAQKASLNGTSAVRSSAEASGSPVSACDARARGLPRARGLS